MSKYVNHMVLDGSRRHVISWNDKDGATCSEPHCEINKGIINKDKEDYDDAFSDGYSAGRREVLDHVHQIHDKIKSKGYDNISKEDMRFAIKTIAEYFSEG